MIEEYRGNVWDLHRTMWVVVPTNLGWTEAGYNVMGAGLAAQAAAKFPGLPKALGERYRYLCSRHMKHLCHVQHFTDERIVAAVTKPLSVQTPHLSWRNRATLEQVRETCHSLRAFAECVTFQIAITPLGCGLGGLREADVLPIMRHYLDDTFMLVRK